jgi:hypothetical protein
LRILKYEFFKVLSGRFILICVSLFILNGFLIYTNELGRNGNISPKAYKEISLYLDGMSDSEKISALEDKHEELSVYMAIFESESTGDLFLIKDLLDKNNGDISALLIKYKHGDYLEFTDNLFSVYILISETVRELRTIMGYDEYLQEIEENAKKFRNISIFSARYLFISQYNKDR